MSIACRPLFKKLTLAGMKTWYHTLHRKQKINKQITKYVLFCKMTKLIIIAKAVQKIKPIQCVQFHLIYLISSLNIHSDDKDKIGDDRMDG